MSHILHRPDDHEAPPFVPQPKVLSYSSAVSGKWKQGPLPPPAPPRPEHDDFPSLPSPFGSDLSFSSSPTSSSHDTLPPIPELPEPRPSSSTKDADADADAYTVDLHTPLLAALDRLDAPAAPGTCALDPRTASFAPSAALTPVAQHPPRTPPLRPWSTPFARALAARTPAARATHAHAVVALRDWTPARTADLAWCVAAACAVPATAEHAAAAAGALDGAFRACYGDARFAWHVRDYAMGTFAGWWAPDGAYALKPGADAAGALALAAAVGALSGAGVLAHGDLRACVRLLAAQRGTLEGLRALGALLEHGDVAGLRACAGEVRGVLAGLGWSGIESAVGARVEEREAREAVEAVRRVAAERVFGPAEA